jgi:GNAT superfamily N-acetyltransferase
MIDYAYRFGEAAAALYDALGEDAFYINLEAAADEDARSAMLRYLDYSLIEAEQHGVLSVHPEQIAAAAWSKPLERALAQAVGEQKKDFIRDNMGKRCLDVYCNMTSNMAARTETVIPDECWYLSIVGVAPAHQGCGLGRRMVEEVLRRTDAANICTYLETFTPRNVRFYEGLGYVTAGEFHEGTANSNYCVMLRPASV